LELASLWGLFQFGPEVAMKSADENQIVWDLLEWGNLEALKILGLDPGGWEPNIGALPDGISMVLAGKIS
jgi:hypothetical protein